MIRWIAPVLLISLLFGGMPVPGMAQDRATQVHPVVLVAGSNELPPLLYLQSAAVVARDTLVALGKVIDERYGQPLLIRWGEIAHIPMHPVCAPIHERAPGHVLGKRVGPEIMVLTGALPPGTPGYNVSFNLPVVGSPVTLAGYNRALELKTMPATVEGFRSEIPFQVPLRETPILLMLLSHGSKRADAPPAGWIRDPGQEDLTFGAAVLDRTGRLIGLLSDNGRIYGEDLYRIAVPLATGLDSCRPLLERLLSR